MKQQSNMIILRNINCAYLKYNLITNLSNIIQKRSLNNIWLLLYEDCSIINKLFFKNTTLEIVLDKLIEMSVLTKYLDGSGRILIIGTDGIELEVRFFNINHEPIMFDVTEGLL
jgi:hypothetical protein